MTEVITGLSITQWCFVKAESPSLSCFCALLGSFPGSLLHIRGMGLSLFILLPIKMSFYGLRTSDIVQLDMNSWGTYMFKKFSKPTVRLMLKYTTNPAIALRVLAY